jgi:hypothetical protein
VLFVEKYLSWEQGRASGREESRSVATKSWARPIDQEVMDVRKRILGLIAGLMLILIASPANACVEIDPSGFDPTNPEASPARVEPSRC